MIESPLKFQPGDGHQWACAVCGRRFGARGWLARHLERVHLLTGAARADVVKAADHFQTAARHLESQKHPPSR